MRSFDWITQFRALHERPATIAELIPEVFVHYLLIPWPPAIIDDFPFDEYPEANFRLADLNKQHAIRRAFGLFLAKDIEHLYRETTLRELASRFDVPYCARTISLLKRTPGVVAFESQMERKLAVLLHHLKAGNELNLFIEDNMSFIDDNRRYEAPHETSWEYTEQHRLSGIDDYCRFLEHSNWKSTSFMFPDDRKWCLCTLEDFPHLIFCCDDPTDTAVRQFRDLETFEVDRAYRLFPD